MGQSGTHIAAIRAAATRDRPPHRLPSTLAMPYPDADRRELSWTLVAVLSLLPAPQCLLHGFFPFPDRSRNSPPHEHPRSVLFPASARPRSPRLPARRAASPGLAVPARGLTPPAPHGERPRPCLRPSRRLCSTDQHLDLG